MGNWWLRFGCFLTGYNYGIVRASSEVSAKAVKRYTAALLIVCILWSFIGYTFTKRYVHGGTYGSIIGAVLFVIIIIQVERQIILSINPSKWLYFFRGIIAMMMAIIGAVILDQIIFKEDIELEKITFIENRVKKAIGPKTEELRNQIATIDTAISAKEKEKEKLLIEIGQKPKIQVITKQTEIRQQTVTVIDSVTGKPLVSVKPVPVMVTHVAQEDNPKIGLLQPIDETINNMRLGKSVREQALLNIRPQLEKEISSKVGFLDELEVMYSLISRSGVALSIWLIWFFFLLGLEMLVLIGKINEKENDYEKAVKHHMELQMRKLALFARVSDDGR